MIKIAVHRGDNEKNIITLLEDVNVAWHEYTFTVPAGFACDGCSVPTFLWDSISPQIDPRTLRGAVVHDYIYRGNVPGISREEADELFLDFIREDGLSSLRAYLAYWGVRLAGAGSFAGVAA